MSCLKLSIHFDEWHFLIDTQIQRDCRESKSQTPLGQGWGFPGDLLVDLFYLFCFPGPVEFSVEFVHPSLLCNEGEILFH